MRRTREVAGGAALIALPALVALLSGCKPDDVKPEPPTPVAANVLFAGQVCAVEGEDPAIFWIDSATQWTRWQKDTPRQVLGLDVTTGTVQPASKPTVDFEREAVVLVGLGQKPTGGYSISLADPGAQIQEQTLTLHVAIESPPKDAYVIQVITSPCVAVKVPKLPVARLRAVDRSGTVIAESPLP